MPVLFLLLLPVGVSVSFCFLLQKNKAMIIFTRAEENTGGGKKTNRDANQVDEERNGRASIFLPTNPFKINTSWFNSVATRSG